MQELGNAINDSLSESDRIAEAIGEIKKAGYDVFLVLEATIGFNRREEGSENEEEEIEVTEEPSAPHAEPPRPSAAASTADIPVAAVRDASTVDTSQPPRPAGL